MVNIAVLGYGTVGSGVVEVLRTNQESIDNKAGEHINLKYVHQATRLLFSKMTYRKCQPLPSITIQMEEKTLQIKKLCLTD